MPRTPHLDTMFENLFGGGTDDHNHSIAPLSVDQQKFFGRLSQAEGLCSLSTKRQSLARDDGNGIEVSKWANGKCYKIPPPAASHRAFHEYKNMLVTNRVVYGLKVWATNGLVFYSKRHKWNIPGEIDKKERFEGEFSHFPKNFQEKLLLEGNDDEVLDSFGFWTLDYGVEQDPLGRDWDLYWFLVHRGEDWLCDEERVQ
ncbi:hypothetical protein GTA08_BOTSDO01538 [Botryosphaeria dothidea]|uniref:Uncharacterized protein n=1 Tax=Botryosphaeria dothidea TaxID=55169 RepID=A0A8H4N6G8_9PEZI|nr:hypothetical protein GTA08_BOTSDO01538 [Botryosphaeria dothidea]